MMNGSVHLPPKKKVGKIDAMWLIHKSKGTNLRPRESIVFFCTKQIYALFEVVPVNGGDDGWMDASRQQMRKDTHPMLIAVIRKGGDVPMCNS